MSCVVMQVASLSFNLATINFTKLESLFTQAISDEKDHLVSDELSKLSQVDGAVDEAVVNIVELLKASDDRLFVPEYAEIMKSPPPPTRSLRSRASTSASVSAAPEDDRGKLRRASEEIDRRAFQNCLVPTKSADRVTACLEAISVAMWAIKSQHVSDALKQ